MKCFSKHAKYYEMKVIQEPKKLVKVKKNKLMKKHAKYHEMKVIKEPKKLVKVKKNKLMKKTCKILGDGITMQICL